MLSHAVPFDIDCLITLKKGNDLVCFNCPAQRSQRTMMVPCDTEYPAFVSERTIKETTGNIDCNGCVR